jgi:choline kinase
MKVRLGETPKPTRETRALPGLRRAHLTSRPAHPMQRGAKGKRAPAVVRQMITQAFVLGAGLGLRLRPLTEELPKPLVPIFQKTLITFALDHLAAAGVRSFVINTHHLPEHFESFFGDGHYRQLPVRLVHEPLLLETGGGMKNAQPHLGSEPFIAYSGDVLTDLPLEPLIEEHLRSGNDVTLALRETGLASNVAFRDRRIVDIGKSRELRLRQHLGLESADLRAHSIGQKDLLHPDSRRVDRCGRKDRRRRFERRALVQPRLTRGILDRAPHDPRRLAPSLRSGTRVAGADRAGRGNRPERASTRLLLDRPRLQRWRWRADRRLDPLDRCTNCFSLPAQRLYRPRRSPSRRRADWRRDLALDKNESGIQEPEERSRSFVVSPALRFPNSRTSRLLSDDP